MTHKEDPFDLVLPRGRATEPPRDTKDQLSTDHKPAGVLCKLSAEKQDQLAKLRVQIMQCHDSVKVMTLTTVLRAIQLGGYCLRAKDILGHGRFKPWVESEITSRGGPSLRTIQRYQNLALRREELVARAAEVFGSSGALTLASAEELLQQLNLEDAVSMLRSGTVKRKSDESSGAHRDTYESPASQFFGDRSTAFLAYWNWSPNSPKTLKGCCVLAPAKPRYSRKAAEIFLAAKKRRDMEEGLLIIPESTATRAIEQLDPYPRLLIRGDASGSPHSIYALIAPQRLANFHAAFGHMGVLLVPFNAPPMRLGLPEPSQEDSQ